MEFGIGYNPSKAKTSIEELNSTYNGLKSSLQSAWDTLISSIQKEWVGVDEQDFELKFAQRINLLHRNSYALVYRYASIIAVAISKWEEFQKNNLMQVGDSDSGSVATNSATGMSEAEFKALAVESLSKLGVTMTQPSDAYPEDIVARKEVTFGPDTTYGLLNGTSSYNNITSALDTYKTDVSTTIEKLFSAEDSFGLYGSQATGLKKYKEVVSSNIKDVSTDIQDVLEALETQINVNYKASDDAMNSVFSSVNIDNTVGSGSRWSE